MSSRTESLDTAALLGDLRRVFSITVVSYGEGLDIGIVGDTQTFSDAWDLMDDIRLELAELAAVVNTERSAD